MKCPEGTDQRLLTHDLDTASKVPPKSQTSKSSTQVQTASHESANQRLLTHVQAIPMKSPVGTNQRLLTRDPDTDNKVPPENTASLKRADNQSQTSCQEVPACYLDSLVVNEINNVGTDFLAPQPSTQKIDQINPVSPGSPKTSYEYTKESKSQNNSSCLEEPARYPDRHGVCELNNVNTKFLVPQLITQKNDQINPSSPGSPKTRYEKSMDTKSHKHSSCPGMPACHRDRNVMIELINANTELQLPQLITRESSHTSVEITGTKRRTEATSNLTPPIARGLTQS